MANFHFDLVAPDKLLFSGEVDQVDLPGAEGDFGVLADHAPMVVLLRPGVISVIVGGQAERIVIFGGFAEISPQGLTFSPTTQARCRISIRPRWRSALPRPKTRSRKWSLDQCWTARSSGSIISRRSVPSWKERPGTN